MIACLLRRPRCALALALVVETAIFVAGQGDFAASDPLWYADLAHRIASDPAAAFAAPSNHPFEMRVGLTLALALLYRGLGVSTLVTNLPSLLAALGMVVVVFAALPTPRAKLLGMVFTVACVPLADHAVILGVDLPCATLMACSVLGLARRDRRHGTVWVAAAMVAWYAAFLVKETALWCAPVWLYAISRDLRTTELRSVIRTFAPGLVLGGALGAAYLVVCARVWGDPWARFAGIQELTHAHAWSMQGQSASSWVERMTWAPALKLAKLFKLQLALAVISPRLVGGRDRIWCVAAAAITLLFWFGSASATAYEPLPVLPRMLLPVMPGILVLAALSADVILERVRDSRRAALAIGLVAAIAVPSGSAIYRLVVRDRPQLAVYAELRREVADPAHRIVVVCSDARSVGLGELYFGFAPPPNLWITTPARFAAAPPGAAMVRALVDVPRDASRWWPQQIERLALVPIVGRYLYDAGDGARLRAMLSTAAVGD